MEVDPPAVNVRDVHKSDVDESEFPHLLSQYYSRLFPYAKYFKWLSYGSLDKNVFQNREFSFTLKDDVYIRYQSFTDLAEMTAAIQKRCPYKIDIGAVFTAMPRDHKKIKSSEFYPTEKELVFDIDMTDYDEIRTCCVGAAICDRCWPFMNVAMKIIDQALREDFGFRHLLWVYSGRRGIHCWVCDKRARRLSQDARSAVAEYLSVVKGGDHAARKVSLTSPPHPALERALAIASPYFESIVIAQDGQNLLAYPDKAEKLLSIIDDEKLEAEIKQLWKEEKMTSPQMWADLCERLRRDSKRNKALLTRRNEIILQYTYPRLDVNVSKGLNHLLKSPFVVHPKTGRVCVPIDMTRPEKFDPSTVPTISDLCSEIDDAHALAAENPDEDISKGQDWKKTSLVKSIEVFDKFLAGLQAEHKADRAYMHDLEEQKGDW